jgi:hypothetical protein
LVVGGCSNIRDPIPMRKQVKQIPHPASGRIEIAPDTPAVLLLPGSALQVITRVTSGRASWDGALNFGTN